MKARRSFWIPTRPYGLIDAINRMGAATGSCRTAMLTSHANYNGHRVILDYRPHALGGARWITEHFWAGRVVHARGFGRSGFESCLRAGIEEHKRGALGATFVVYLEEGIADFSVEEQAAICEAAGLAPHSREIEEEHDRTFRDARFEEINSAMRYESQLGAPAVGFLANSATVEEYRAKLDAFFAERKARKSAS